MRAAAAAAAATRSLHSTCVVPSPIPAGAVLDPGHFEVEDLEPDLWAERANMASPSAQIAHIFAEQDKLAEEQEQMSRMVARLKDLLAGSKLAGC
jgi:hypothetical protein